MTDVSIGWVGLAASLLLVAVTVGVSRGRRLGLEQDLVVASARAIGQLLLAGWALTLLLADDVQIAWAWLWVATMVPVAAWSARRREPRLPGIMVATTVGYTLGLGASLAVVFGFDV
ncbi:MAG: ABC transporter permease, partial [Acidimicrobiales bacterium]|nr:ABC transporter permease [Acidimicrobiales bacterium]